MSVLSETEVKEWLLNAWEQVIGSMAKDPDPDMDILVDSNVVAIRYAIITQLLGKFADHQRDALCLQRGKAQGPGAEKYWDPRGFCSRVVVPWVQNTSNVLGTSSDPYVSKPLRRSHLKERFDSLRDKDKWVSLLNVLEDVETRNSRVFTEKQLQRCLHSIARRFSRLSIKYPIPNRISLSQTQNIVSQFLQHGSGGEKPLIVTTALICAFNERFSLFSRIDSQKINQADVASGVPGDILCYQNHGDEEILQLAIEVKDRKLTITELDSTIGKARRSRLTEILFVTRGIDESEKEEIVSRIGREWAQGTNVYDLTLQDLIRVIFSIAGEKCRIDFLHAVGNQIDEKASQPDLKSEWADLLNSLTEG